MMPKLDLKILLGNKITTLCFFMLFFLSCRNQQREQFFLQTLEAGLIENSKVIHRSNEVIYESIDLKANDRETREIAEKVLEKADSVRAKTAGIYKLITSLKQTLLKDNTDKRKSGHRTSFFNLLKQQYKELLSIDTLFASQYLNKQLLTPKFFANDLSDFEKNLKNSSAEQVGGFLSKLAGDVLVDENTLLNHLHDEIRITRRCFFVSTLIGVSSNVISAGDSVEITGGIGYFESDKRSKMIIDGFTIYPSENNLFRYQYKPSGKPGKKRIPVQIFYTDADGNDVVNETNLIVTVR